MKIKTRSKSSSKMVAMIVKSSQKLRKEKVNKKVRFIQKMSVCISLLLKHLAKLMPMLIFDLISRTQTLVIFWSIVALCALLSRLTLVMLRFQVSH